MDLSRLKLKPHKLFHHLDEVIKWREGKPFAPIYVEVSTIDICNQKCIFCYTDYLGHQKNLEIKRDLLLRIFRDLGETGVKAVFIQGTGEPLLNSATFDAIVEGKKAGLDLSLSTNCVLFDEENLEKCIPALSWMRVCALDSKPESYAKTHGCPEGHFHRVIKNLSKAVEIRNRELSKNKNIETVISVHFIPLPHNINSIIDTAKLMKDIGVDYMQIKPAAIRKSNVHHKWPKDIHITYQNIIEKCKELTTNEFVVDVRWDEFEKRVTTEDEGTFRKSYNACYGQYFETMIDADAKVYPCFKLWRDERYCIGDLSKKSFREIWFSDRRIQVLEDHAKNYDLSQCDHACRHHHINETLWELANPPMHKNFL